MELRPLDFGGILERAITLYARNFIGFIGLVVVTVVPVAVVQYLVLLGEQPRLDATLDILRHPDRLRTEHVPTLFNSPAMLAVAIAAALFGYYLSGFALGAVAAAVARRYDGDPISFRGCYEAVLRHWVAIVAVVGVAVLALVVAYLGAILVVAVPVFIAVAMAASWFSSVVTLALAAMVFIMLFALAVIGVTSACAVCAVVVEECAATRSLQLTFGRILNRREFGRALICAFTVGSIGFVASTFVDTAGFLELSRWPAAYVTLDALERTMVVPFLALVFSVYYFDVRVRQEGYDLATALEREPDEPAYAPTAYLSGEERALIKRFLERRDSLQPLQRREIAAQLAAPARKRVPPELQRLSDEALLERL